MLYVHYFCSLTSRTNYCSNFSAHKNVLTLFLFCCDNMKIIYVETFISVFLVFFSRLSKQWNKQETLFFPAVSDVCHGRLCEKYRVELYFLFPQCAPKWATFCGQVRGLVPCSINFGCNILFYIIIF